MACEWAYATKPINIVKIDLKPKPLFIKMRLAHPNPEQKRQYRPKLLYLAISCLNIVHAKPEVDSKEDHNIDPYRSNSSDCPTFSTIRCTIDNADWLLMPTLYLIWTQLLSKRVERRSFNGNLHTFTPHNSIFRDHRNFLWLHNHGDNDIVANRRQAVFRKFKKFITNIDLTNYIKCSYLQI